MAPSPLLNVHRPPPTASNARRVSVKACAAQGRNGTAHQPSVLPSLKWDRKGLVTAIVQHVETGEVLMQAFADEAAVLETLETGQVWQAMGARVEAQACHKPASSSGSMFLSRTIPVHAG